MVKNTNPLILTFDIDGLYGSEIPVTKGILNILKKGRSTATFFVTAIHAEKHPDLIDLILDEGHEVACHGYDHSVITDLSPVMFSEWLKTATDMLQRIVRKKIFGFKAPNSMIPRWGPSILHRLGYKYDSSVQPCIPIPFWYGAPRAPLYPYYPSFENIYVESPLNRSFKEFPQAVFPGIRIPVGGWWIRNLGLTWTQLAVRKLLNDGVVTLYLHPWEFQERKSLTGIECLNFMQKTILFRKTGGHMFSFLKSIVSKIQGEKISVEMALERSL